MKQEIILNQRIIECARMVLRPIRSSDVGLMTHYAADKRLAEMTASIPHPLPPGAMQAYYHAVTRADRSEFAWVMDATSFGGSELLGVVNLQKVQPERSEISYWVAPSLWNTGFASEAVAAMVRANPLEDKTYFASVFQDNPRSARVVTNLGFEYLGDAEIFSVARNASVATWTYLKSLA